VAVDTNREGGKKMWDENQLSKEIDSYYDNVSKEQFESDLKQTKSDKFVEDIKQD